MRENRKLAMPYGKWAKVPMPNGCLYCNNDGSRWVHQDMRFVLVTPHGIRIRLAICYEAFGAFAAIVYKYKGRTFRGLPKSANNTEHREENATGINALPHIFHS